MSFQTVSCRALTGGSTSSSLWDLYRSTDRVFTWEPYIPIERHGKEGSPDWAFRSGFPARLHICNTDHNLDFCESLVSRE